MAPAAPPALPIEPPAPAETPAPLEAPAHAAPMIIDVPMGAPLEPPAPLEPADPPEPAEPVIIPISTPAPLATAEERRARAAELIAARRRAGIDYRWLEATGEYLPVVAMPGAALIPGDDARIAEVRPEVRELLDAERSQPGWRNPTPCEPADVEGRDPAGAEGTSPAIADPPAELAAPEPPRRASRRAPAPPSGNGRPTNKETPRPHGVRADGITTGNAASGRVLERLRRQRAQGDPHPNGKPRKGRQ
jgi:hypothetical protein